MNTLHLDIEIAPDWDAIDLHFPIGEPPEFDASSVKYGVAKKPETRAKIEAEALAKHNALVEQWGNDAHLNRHRREALDSSKALLNPCISSVCAIGSKLGDRDLLIYYSEDCEGCMLQELVVDIEGADAIAGWNIKGFDLPYLTMRMRVHGITPPPLMLPNGRYYRDSVIDLMEWAGCNQWGRNYKLKHVAPALGFRACPEPEGGKFFWEMPRDKQTEYLTWDVEAVAHIYNVMAGRPTA